MELRHHNSKPSVRGAALVVGLIFLLILTIIALAASQVSIQQERMAGNVREYNEAFQAAERTLRDMEQRVVALAQGQSAGFNNPPGNWFEEALERNDCTGSRKWGTTGWTQGWREDAIGVPCEVGSDPDDAGCFIIVDVASTQEGEEISGSTCAPMDESGNSPLGQYFLVVARGKGSAEQGEAVVQSMYYWP